MNLRIPSSKYSYRKYSVLSVSFKMSKDYLKTDKEVTSIVGIKPMGAGILLKKGVRDLSFKFDKEIAAENAQKSLKKGGFVSRITIYETDTP